MTYQSEILRLRAEGLTYNEIVARLGCAKSTVCYYLGSDQSSKTLVRQQEIRRDINDYINEYKESRGCQDCKVKYPYWILDLDHLGEVEKLFSLSRYSTITKDIEIVKQEIQKCEVVCSNCHRQRTRDRFLALRNTIGV